MDTPHSRDVVDDIRRLYGQITPIEDIARRLDLSESIVRHAIEHGRLPSAEPHWEPIE